MKNMGKGSKDMSGGGIAPEVKLGAELKMPAEVRQRRMPCYHQI